MIDIEDSACQWSCDYEPGSDVDAIPQRHARAGFEAGAKWMQQAFGLEKITIINVCDYQAIYNGDTLIHYHDVPIGGALLDLLGIDNEELCPEDFGLTEDDFDRVRTAVRSLPVKYREVVVLKYLQELSTEKICEILGVSDNVVYVRLNRARAMLKDKLSNLMDG